MASVTTCKVLARLLLTALLATALACVIATPFMPLFSLSKEIKLAAARTHTGGEKGRAGGGGGNFINKEDTFELDELHDGGQQGYSWFSMEQLLWTTRIHTVIPGIPSRIAAHELYKNLPQLVADFRILQYLDATALLSTGGVVLLNFVWLGAMLVVVVRQKCPSRGGSDGGSASPEDSAIRLTSVATSGATVAGESNGGDLDAGLAKLERSFLRPATSMFLVCSALSLSLAARGLAKLYTTNYKLRDPNEPDSNGIEGGFLRKFVFAAEEEDCNPLDGCIYSFASMGFTREVGWTLVMGATAATLAACACQVLLCLASCLCRRRNGGHADNEDGGSHANLNGYSGDVSGGEREDGYTRLAQEEDSEAITISDSLPPSKKSK